MIKHIITTLFIATLAAPAARADSTGRHFARIGKTTYVSLRCQCGATALVGKTTASEEDGNLRIAAFRCEDGFTFYESGSTLGGYFGTNLYVSNACYRWMLITPKGRVVDARILKVTP